MPMEEFQEIYLSGGKFELKKCSDGRVSVEYSSLNPWPMAMFQVCVSLDGKILDTVPFGGIGKVIPYPQPLAKPHVRLPKHRHNLLCTIPLLHHENPFRPPAVWILSQQLDQFTGRGSFGVALQDGRLQRVEAIPFTWQRGQVVGQCHRGGR